MRDKRGTAPTTTVYKDGSVKGLALAGLKKNGSDMGLKVLAHVHLYPPTHNAGAEWMMHALLRYGVERRGWQVQVITDHLPVRSDTWQGIKVRHDRNVQRLGVDYRFSEVIITHLDATRKAQAFAARAGRPLVHMVHNDLQLTYHNVAQRDCALAIFNSAWIQRSYEWPGNSVVLYPPTRMEDYAINPTGKMVTLLNMSVAKGADTFFAAARSNPTMDFLGVEGSYGHQEAADIPNLETIGNQADVSKVYQRTKVLMVPSHYESWGRVAVEAACSGIPSLCTPTPGLREANVAAAFIEPGDIGRWNLELRQLMRSPGAWEDASGRARERAIELDAISEAQLEETAVAMEGLR